MNWNHLLSCIRPELLKEVMIEFGLPPTTDKGLMKKTIISFLGRNSIDEERRLVEFLREQVMTYELSTIIQMTGLDKPADRTQYFDYIIGNLDFVEREEEEEGEVLRQEDVTKVKLDDIKTEKEAGPEYTKEDERDWGVEASRMVGLFRKINYTLGEAVADVIDNSIDVGATEVNIHYEMDRQNGCRYLIIADNGIGMDEETMQESMYLGMDRKREDSELGKFGVGLKISSLSQAEEIIVISDHKDTDETIVRRISYPYIQETNSLKLLTKVGRDILHFDDAMQSLPLPSGTVVLWEKMDANPIPYARQKAYRDEFEKQKEKLRGAIALRFHRYISGDTESGRKIVINLQNNPIQPIDPLGQDFTNDQGYGTLSETVIKTYEDTLGNEYDIPVTLIVQPHRERIEPTVYQRLKDAVGSDKNAQGLYLYRNDRLIKMGGWMDVGGRIPHASLNLCRVGIDIPITLDDEFKLEPTKTDYTLPQHFKDDLNLQFNSTSRKFADGPIQYTFLKRGQIRARHESKVRKHKDHPKVKSSKTTRSTTSPGLAKSDSGLMTTKTVKAEPKDSKKGKVSIDIVDSPFMSELAWVETKVTGTKLYLNKGHRLYNKTREALRELD
jgi:hypothetical protein